MQQVQQVLQGDSKQALLCLSGAALKERGSNLAERNYIERALQESTCYARREHLHIQRSLQESTCYASCYAKERYKRAPAMPPVLQERAERASSLRRRLARLARERRKSM